MPILVLTVRYITRGRPVRNRLLRQRAAQVENERQGLTTDDDNVSGERDSQNPCHTCAYITYDGLWIWL